jgi:hypothetical protein
VGGTLGKKAVLDEKATLWNPSIMKIQLSNTPPVMERTVAAGV